jgi:hypothetical protein
MLRKTSTTATHHVVAERPSAGTLRAIVSGARITRALLASLFVFLAVVLAAGRSEAQNFASGNEIKAIDDAGPDDLPGQKDINYLSLNYATTNDAVRARWGFDDTSWSGNNTGDGCVLFDQDQDGKANVAFCVTVEKAGVFKAFRAYTCSDAASDRCTNPVIKTTLTSSGSASFRADPFASLAIHATGNTCSAKQGCYAQDTEAEAIVKFADFSGVPTTFVNVCTYPSQEPNSAPSDCVFTPNNGFLTITKTAGGDTTTTFTFNLATGQTFQDGTNTKTAQEGNPAQLISMRPNTDDANQPIAGVASYDLSEAIPLGWKLTVAGCTIQGNSAVGTADTLPITGSATASGGVQNVVIKSGLLTTCAFTNEEGKKTPSISTTQSSVVKLSDNATISGLKTGGGNATAVFRLYTTLANCQAWGSTGMVAGSEESVALTNDTLTTVTPAMTTAVGVGNGTYFWGVKYSGNTFNNEKVDCSESTIVSITIDDDITTP